MVRKRNPARDRHTLPEWRLSEHVVIECHCGKRFADLAETSPTYGRDASDHLGTTGNWFVRRHRAARTSFDDRRSEIERRADGKSAHVRAAIATNLTRFEGIADIGQEDWCRVVCPQCNRDHRLREVDLVALIRLACSLSARRISLAQHDAAMNIYRASRQRVGNSLGL